MIGRPHGVMRIPWRIGTVALYDYRPLGKKNNQQRGIVIASAEKLLMLWRRPRIKKVYPIGFPETVCLPMVDRYSIYIYIID